VLQWRSTPLRTVSVACVEEERDEPAWQEPNNLVARVCALGEETRIAAWLVEAEAWPRPFRWGGTERELLDRRYRFAREGRAGYGREPRQAAWAAALGWRDRTTFEGEAAFERRLLAASTGG
jgi:hypothetical protein